MQHRSSSFLLSVILCYIVATVLGTPVPSIPPVPAGNKTGSAAARSVDGETPAPESRMVSDVVCTGLCGGFGRSADGKTPAPKVSNDSAEARSVDGVTPGSRMASDVICTGLCGNIGRVVMEAETAAPKGSNDSADARALNGK